MAGYFLMRRILQDVKRVLGEHGAIDTWQNLIVNLNAFSDSSVDFYVYTFTLTSNWVKFHPIKQDILLRI